MLDRELYFFDLSYYATMPLLITRDYFHQKINQAKTKAIYKTTKRPRPTNPSKGSVGRGTKL